MFYCEDSYSYFLFPHSQNPDYDPDAGGDERENPGAHRNFGFRPAFGFKMMMERRRQKNFAMKKLLARELNDHAS